MTEDDARSRVAAMVSRETLAALVKLAQLVEAEADRQNLVAKSTMPHLWSRHILDSLQLVPLSGSEIRCWIDVGTGAGFPGLVTAIATGAPTTLVEPRRLRTSFLARAATELSLDKVTIVTGRAATMPAQAATVLSARAVASLKTLLAAMYHLAGPDTLWLLPKGRNAASELAEARMTWQGDFAMHPSITDADATIIVAKNVTRRGEERA